MIKTMRTPPGYIPEDSEWDMPASLDDIDDIIKSKQKSQNMPDAAQQEVIRENLDD